MYCHKYWFSVCLQGRKTVPLSRHMCALMSSFRQAIFDRRCDFYRVRFAWKKRQLLFSNPSLAPLNQFFLLDVQRANSTRYERGVCSIGQRKKSPEKSDDSGTYYLSFFLLCRFRREGGGALFQEGSYVGGGGGGDPGSKHCSDAASTAFIWLPGRPQLRRVNTAAHAYPYSSSRGQPQISASNSMTVSRCETTIEGCLRTNHYYFLI